MRKIFYSVLTIIGALTVLLVSSCEKPSQNDGTAPAVTIAVVEAALDSTSAGLTITPVNATAVAWQVIESGAPVPSAEDILANGTQASATETSTVTATGLTPSTSYVAVVAASNEEGAVSSVASATFTTKSADGTGNGDNPPVGGDLSVSIVNVIAHKTSATLTFEQNGAEKMAYLLLPGTTQDAPAASVVMSTGTSFDPSAESVEIDNLDYNTTYLLAIAASAGDEYSNVAIKTFTTLFAWSIEGDLTDVTFTGVDIDINTNRTPYEITATFTDDTNISLQVTMYGYKNFDLGCVNTGTYTIVNSQLAGNEFDLLQGAIYAASDIRGTVVRKGNGYSAVTSGTLTVNKDRTVDFDFIFNQDNILKARFDQPFDLSKISVLGSDLTADHEADFGENPKFMIELWPLTNSAYASTPIVGFYVGPRGTEGAMGDAIWIEINVKAGTTTIPTGTFEDDKDELGTANTFRIGHADTYNTFGYWSWPTKGTGLEIRETGWHSTPRNYLAASAYDGTITITANDDETYTVSFDLLDDVGYRFHGTYTGHPAIAR